MVRSTMLSMLLLLPHAVLHSDTMVSLCSMHVVAVAILAVLLYRSERTYRPVHLLKDQHSAQLQHAATYILQQCYSTAVGWIT